jgi:two-component system, OmpR family, sensor kinase
VRSRRRRQRSLRDRLALLFLAVTALALAVVIFIFLPRLESNIEGQKLADLEETAAAATPELRTAVRRELSAQQIDDIVREASDRSGARLTLLGIQQSSAGPRPRLYVISDSNQRAAVETDWPVAARAVASSDGAETASTVVGDRGVVAVPLFYAGSPGWVANFSRDVGDASEAVAIVRNRLLLASAVALLVAFAGGWLVARRLAKRVTRLESAARRVAAGRSVEPLPVETDDELGRLTRAFNDMQAQLARVERARREFIANASHELRTPIFSLGGFVELLQDEQLDPATREEFLQTMSEQIERLQKLSVDLLDLSRLDAGSLDVDRERVDLGELAGTVAAEFQPALVSHQTQLRLRVPEDPVEAVCDRARVTQIMRILLDNALRHTPEGTPVTVIAARQNGNAELTVRDKGPGVLPTSAGQVFERFYTENAASGSGLGLAIARELAERMEGTITLKSRPGVTAFTLTLPVPADGFAE